MDWPWRRPVEHPAGAGGCCQGLPGLRPAGPIPRCPSVGRLRRRLRVRWPESPCRPRRRPGRCGHWRC
eukprot:4554482-Lingulodinium_polyedra.AAC.1